MPRARVARRARPRGSAEEAPGGGLVLLELRDERLRPLEPLRLPKPGDEVDPHPLPVEIPVDVESVDLNGSLGLPKVGRPPRFIIPPMAPARVWTRTAYTPSGGSSL